MLSREARMRSSSLEIESRMIRVDYVEAKGRVSKLKITMPSFQINLEFPISFCWVDFVGPFVMFCHLGLLYN